MSQQPLWWPQRAAALSRRLAIYLGLIALVSGCASEDLPQNFLEPTGRVAVEIDALWDLVFPIAVGVFVLVEGTLLFVLFRFRARGTDTSLPKQVQGNARLEVVWTIIPALILAVIAVPTVQTIFSLAEGPPPDALELRVIAKQYWWEFEYPEALGGVVTAGEMYMPTGRPVHLTMESFGQAHGDPLGVIHSFWVPKLGGKQDVVPGHVRTLDLIADEPGKYRGQCAEFCGLGHAFMRFAVVVLPPDEFEAWVAQQQEPQGRPDGRLARQGYDLFETAQCVACHAIKGYQTSTGGPADARIGPDLTYLWERDEFAGYWVETNEDNLRAWLENPQAVKPGAQMPNLQLSDEQIRALVAYLRTLEFGGATHRR